ncbi:MAG: glycosyltransferase family 2 protein [Bacteroidales bacterium]|nr:glycosyltransferase family 2 protein [Bacteroidales bacterium]
MLECSVIILNWNGEAMLRRFLPIVIAHTQLNGVEVVVADNGSTDGSLAYLRTQSVRIIDLGYNYGFAEGYNRAIAQVDSKYVVLLNSDVEVTPNWLDTLLNYARAHEEVAVLQPKVLSWHSKQDMLQGKTEKVRFEHAGAAGGMIDCLGYPYCRGRLLTYLEEDEGQYDAVAPIFWASGACFFINREVYLKEGGLDAVFFAHQEEIDLCWRLHCRGYQIMAVPQSVVYHVGGATLEYESPRKTFLNFRNNLLMLYKNLPTMKWLLVMLIRMPLDYVAALQMLFAGKLLNFKAVLQARCAFWKLRMSYGEKRSDCIRSSKTLNPTLISKRSIIFDYYLLGKRK